MRPLDRLLRFVVAATVYVAFSLLWLYGILDAGRVDEESWFMWTVLATLAVFHVAFGFLTREWVALLLPIALVPLAVPAGYPESRYEPGLVWYGQMFLVLFEVPLIAAGLGLRALYDGLRRAPSPSG
jgi:hypothetical protein